MHSLSRRRFLQVIAATSVSGLATLRASAADDGTIRRWDGEALGADASISLFGLEPDRAEPLLRACRDEIVRLEAVFSLYRETSALTRLNAHGFLADPPMELTDLLDTCRSVHSIRRFSLFGGSMPRPTAILFRRARRSHPRLQRGLASSASARCRGTAGA
jgi:thiamine biosynthesis lipoprotein